jgi:hypothetical protein
MDSKIALACGVAAGVVLGLVGARVATDAGFPSSASAPDAGAAPTDPVAAAAPRTAAPGRESGATLSAGERDAAVAAVAKERDELRAALAETQRQLKEAREAGTTATDKRGPRFTFGEVGKLPAVAQADWKELADASTEVSAALLEMRRLRLAGQEIPQAVRFRLQENTERMRRYEYRTIEKIPTSAQHNGEFTHPVSMANLLAAILEKAGKPLTDAQVEAIVRAGTAFDEDFARLRASWTPDVVRVRRILGEYRLKGAFTDAVWALLTAEQRAAWIDPDLRGIAAIDLLDPTLLVVNTSHLARGATPAEIRSSLSGALRAALGLAADAPAPRLDPLLDAFVTRTARGLAPVPPVNARNFSYAEGLAAGEATVDLVEGVLRELDLPAARKTALADDPTWYVPRLVKA